MVKNDFQEMFENAVHIGHRTHKWNPKMKKFISGETFLPYMTIGYSRWYRNDSDPKSLEKSTPNLLVKRFLNDTEKRNGRFSESLIYPGVGLQYVTLTGPWAGIATSVEVLMLVDLDDLVTAPTGGLNLTYYF